MTNKILITIDRDIMAEYEKHYFKKNPRAKKFPFMTTGKEPKYRYHPPTLNDLLIIQNRMVLNTLKGKYGDFAEWLVDKHNLRNLKLTNVVVEFRISNETKTRKDCDNLTTKFLFDGFVDAGLFEDDSYYYVNPTMMSMNYNKEYPHTEIRITVIDESIKDIYEKTQLHIDTWK